MLEAEILCEGEEKHGEQHCEGYRVLKQLVFVPSIERSWSKETFKLSIVCAAFVTSDKQQLGHDRFGRRWRHLSVITESISTEQDG